MAVRAAPGLQGALKAEATYKDASAMGGYVMQILPMVHFNDNTWHATTERAIIDPVVSSFFRMHGDRAFLKNLCTVLGFSKEDTDYLGRWQAKASDGYIRYSRQKVHYLQRAAAEAMRISPHRVDESIARLELVKHLRARDWSEESAWQHAGRLKCFEFVSGTQTGAVASPITGPEAMIADIAGPAVGPSTPDSVSSLSDVNSDDERLLLNSSFYWINVSPKKGIRTLHKGNCKRCRFNDNSEEVISLRSAEYHTQCVSCFSDLNDMDEGHSTDGTSSTESEQLSEHEV